jgi:hypothetical protein
MALPRLAEREHEVAAWLTLAEIQALTVNTDVRDWIKKIGREFAVTSSAPLQS